MVRSNDFLKARELIVTRTAFGSPERQAVVQIVSDLFVASNPCFDRARFQQALDHAEAEHLLAKV